MSAFVIDRKDMDKVVWAICYTYRPGEQLIHSFAGGKTSTHGSATRIGRKLFEMNCDAVMQRYPNCVGNPDDMPGEEGCWKYPTTYVAEPFTFSGTDLAMLREALEEMRSLRYQCSEGNVPDTALFRELKDAICAVACQIVDMLPAKLPKMVAA